MKIGEKVILEDLKTLNPAASQRLIGRIDLILANGNSFSVDDIQIEKGVIYARSETGMDFWLIVPVDEVIGFQAYMNLTEVTARRIKPEISSILATLRKRK
jgi:hypothetical protein